MPHGATRAPHAFGHRATFGRGAQDVGARGRASVHRLALDLARSGAGRRAQAVAGHEPRTFSADYAGDGGGSAGGPRASHGARGPAAGHRARGVRGVRTAARQPAIEPQGQGSRPPADAGHVAGAQAHAFGAERDRPFFRPPQPQHRHRCAKEVEAWMASGRSLELKDRNVEAGRGHPPRRGNHPACGADWL